MDKKCALKNIPLPILIVVGVFASAISFVYYFVLKNPYEMILWMICLADLLLFAVNAYRAIECLGLTKVKTVVFTIITMLVFFAFCQIVVLAFTDGTRFVYNRELFFDVLRVSLFLSPSFILLIPLMKVVAEIMS